LCKNVDSDIPEVGGVQENWVPISSELIYNDY
jgi:hypothetical protein